MAKKLPEQNAQQAFNQFLFDTMMDKIREVELMAKEINSLKVSDAATIGSFKSLFPRVERLERMLKRIAELEKTVYNSPFSKIVMEDYAEKIKTLEKVNVSFFEKLHVFELKMKEQRGDYHDHIAQFVRENAAAHVQQSDTIMHMKEQIKGLENRLSRAQDMIAECPPSGCITVKKAGRAVGKAAAKVGQEKK